MCFQEILSFATGGLLGGILGGGDEPAPAPQASAVLTPTAPAEPRETAEEKAAREAQEAAAREAEVKRVLTEQEAERERQAALAEDEKRKAAERLEASRFSFGETNLTGPFGLVGQPASVFRPVATPRARQLGA